MELFSEEYFKKLAKECMFAVDDQEIAQLQEEFKALLQQLDRLHAIDTTKVEEMIYPFAQETQFLREDTHVHVLSQEEALSNVSSVKAGHIHVPKVVK